MIFCRSDIDSDLENCILTDLQTQHLNPQQQINWCVFLRFQPDVGIDDVRLISFG